MSTKKIAAMAIAAGMLTAGGAATVHATPAASPVPTALAAFSTPLDDSDNHDGGHDWNHTDGDRGHDWNHTDGNRDRGHDSDRDNGGDHDWRRGWDGDRRHDGDWDGHHWGWWHDWGISAWLCRDGGGHVDWDKHRCDGGRFDDFHVR